MYFEAALLERAISEFNDLQPDMVVCSGDLTTFGFKHEYQLARRYLDSIDCDAASSSPGTMTRATWNTSTSRISSARATPYCRRTAWRSSRSTRRNRDLDHGQIGRGRYPWIEEQFAGAPAKLRIFVLHHHLLPVPGTGRERNVVYDAGDAIECLLRAGVHLVLSGHKHVPYAWRLEHLFVVTTGTVSSLRLRGNTRPCYNVVEVNGNHVSISRRHPFHGEERIIQFSTETFEYEKYTGRIEQEVTTRG